MKPYLQLLRILSSALVGAAMVFSCGNPGEDGPDNPVGPDIPGGKVIPVENVRLDVSTRELIPGEVLQLTATLLPENATDKDEITLDWNSSAPAVATVSNSGLVTAVSDGKATISVSISADKKAVCEITVKTPDRVDGVIKPEDFGQSGGSTAEDLAAGNDFSYRFSPRAALASEEAAGAVSDVWTDGHMYSFSLPSTKDPYNGNTSCIGTDDIVVFRDCEAFPGGAAIRIVSTNAAQNNSGTAEKFSYEGYQVSIEEIFKDLHMETAQLDLGDIRRIEDEEGNPVPFALTKGGGGFEIAIPEMFGKDFTASLDLGDNMSITPKMRVGFNMDIAADVVDFKLTYARCRVEAEADLSCDLTFKAVVEKKFRTKRLTVYLGAIPIGPVVISPVISMDFELKLSGQVDLTLSVAYQKGVYAHVFYNGSNLLCRVGETKPVDPKDPFSASGNLSGAVEFGPNLGMGVSLYGGALTLGADFNPHMVFTVFSSYPISLESLRNAGNGYYWLTEAGFEPSLAFSFGGYIEAAYAWSLNIEVPDELGLSYSFGKTYVVPKVSGPVKIFPERTAATITAPIKNKAMCTGGMYMKVKEADDPSNNWKEVPLNLSGPLNNDEPVDAEAVFSPVKPFQIYTATGPFMKISLFGYEAEVEMARNSGYSFYTVDAQTESAVRALLADIYASRDGKWEGCNWNDPDVPFCRLENVFFHYDTDQEMALYDLGDGRYYRKKLAISIPDNWPMKDNLAIGNRTSGVEDLGWEMTVHGGKVFDSVEIEDPNFVQCFGDESAEYGQFLEFWPVRKRLVVHSKRFGSTHTVNTFFLQLLPSTTDLYVDLSGTDICQFSTAGQSYQVDSDEIPTLSGTVLLDNCKRLYDIVIRGPKMPKKISYTNCPKMKDVRMEWISGSKDFKDYAGNCERLVMANSTGTIAFGPGCSVDYFYVYPTCSIDLLFNGTGVKDFSSTLLSQHEGTGVGAFSATDCLSLTRVDLHDAKSVLISNCPALTSLSVRPGLSDSNGNGYIDRWDGSLESISVSGVTSLRTVDIASSHLGGTLPSWIQSLEPGHAQYPYKYEYWGGTDGKLTVGKTYSNGYTMPGEPGRPYRHCLGGYYEDN